MRPVLEVVEHDETPLPELSDADLALLMDPKLRGYFTLRPVGKSWRLKVRAVTGVLVLDAVELRIQPKIGISGEMLLHWLHYATKPYNTAVDQQRRWDVQGTYFTDLVVAAFLEECRILLRGQLRRDYVRSDSVDGVLRGRLDVVKQASRRYGMLDRLHVRTFDRRAEVWENEVCGAALRYAARHAESPALRREAAALGKMFPACTTAIARSTLTRARHHRMNIHYFAAHTWAALLLRCGGVADLLVQHELPGESRLLDMFRLWESVVFRMVGGSKIQPVRVQRPGGVTYFRPDAVAPLSTGAVAVDAKYKAYDDRNVSREDVHQLLTYSTAYRSGDLPRAVIVHPSESATTSERITVDFDGRVLGVIDVIGVDVRVHPEESSVTLRSLLSG